MSTPGPTPGQFPDRDECVEQAHFFRTFRERLAENVPAQDILGRLDEELLTTTRLPMAVQFVATELRHSGTMASGFARLGHYFTPFQTFVVRQAENEGLRFPMPSALLILEREAAYKSDAPTTAGLFVYQFEAVMRNRLGYVPGLEAAAGDPFYGPEWREYIDLVRRAAGAIDFADLVYLRSEQYVADHRRTVPGYVPPVPPLYGEREGRIAKASRGRDPLYLFAGLQRQLNYPVVPRPRADVDTAGKVDAMLVKMRELEARLRVLEAEQRGTLDPTQFGKPDIFKGMDDGP